MLLSYFLKFSILILLTASCSKPKAFQSTTVKLKDKSLSQIKAAIYGKWKLHYSMGGFTGRIRRDFTNSSIEFKSDDSMYWDNNGLRIVEDFLAWRKMTDMIGDVTYIMSFCEMRNSICYPYSWGVQGIQKDTLILYDNAADPDSYYLTRK